MSTAADTGGEYLEVELRLAADGRVPGAHVHPAQEERFEVLEGRMRFRMGMRTIEAGPGDVVSVRPARPTSSSTRAIGRRWLGLP